MSEKLKTCPFCGGEGYLERKELPDRPRAIRWYVECRNGDCEMKAETSLYQEEEFAIAAWNTRASEQLERVADEMAKALEITEPFFNNHRHYERGEDAYQVTRAALASYAKWKEKLNELR